MGTVVFYVQRSEVDGHAPGDEVALDIDFQDAVRIRIVRKNPIQASDGNPETLYHGADTRWDFETEPVAGDAHARLKEFLDSTASGEEFQIWAYGTESAPIRCFRIDDGVQGDPFLRAGAKNRDYYAPRFSVLEVE